MSETKTKQELVRMAWIAALRREGHRQCDGEMFDGHGGVCAIGLLAEISSIRRHQTDAIVDQAGDFAPIGNRAGLLPEETTAVWEMNDNGWAFDEIADEVEAGFPSRPAPAIKEAG